jgi:hypothetical protein
MINTYRMTASPITASNKTTIDTICSFLSSIGIDVMVGEVPPGTFLPAIEIKNGKLIYDPAQLNYPGDLLHEAGHIAVTTAAQRPALSGNITENDPQKNGDEMAVLLWSYAACLHIDLPPEVVFHADGYKGESQWIITNFQTGQYIGLPLLVWMGLAHNDKHPEGFPKMIKWLRD